MGDASKIEQLNQFVRSYCVMILITAFVAAYLIGVWRAEPVLADSTFVGVLTFAMTWWFKSRDDDKKREGTPPPPGTVTETVTPASVTTTTTAPVAPVAVPPTP